MATKLNVDKWFAGAVGRYMNPDNAYGYQCKDVADDYCITLWGNWVNTVRPGNGKDVFNNANPEYFTKIANNPNDPNQIPQYGDIINWGASKAVPEGHVAVVKSATTKNVTVVEQDGYVQTAARLATHPYQLPNGAMVVGWLRPKLEPEIAKATFEQIKQAYRDILEREADSGGLNHYLNYTIDFVKADLKASDEYKRLCEAKAIKAAQEASEKAKREALLAEQNRLAEEKEAAEQAAIAELAARTKKEAEAAALAKQQAEEAAKNTEARIETIVLENNVLLKSIKMMLVNFIGWIKKFLKGGKQ